MTKALLAKARELESEHAYHADNIRRLQMALPKLAAAEADRARSTIKNLQAQKLRIDVLLLRAECDTEI